MVPCFFFGTGHANTNSSYTQYTNVDTQPSVIINRSPMKNGNDNCAKETKAIYDADSEKVHLNIAEEEKEEAT